MKSNIGNIDGITLSREAISCLCGISVQHLGRLVKDEVITKNGRGKYNLDSVPCYIEYIRKMNGTHADVKAELDIEKLKGLKLENAKRRIELKNTVNSIRRQEREEFGYALTAYIQAIQNEVRKLCEKDRQKLIDAVEEAKIKVGKTMTEEADLLEYINSHGDNDDD